MVAGQLFCADEVSFSYDEHLGGEAGQSVIVYMDVGNTSKVAGDEVTDLYIGYPESSGAPVQALKGFERVNLAPGENRQLTFTLDPHVLSMHSSEPLPRNNCPAESKGTSRAVLG